MWVENFILGVFLVAPTKNLHGYFSDRRV